MSKKIFSAQEWENAPSKKNSPDKSSPISSYSSSSDVQSRVEEIISEIESRGLDIAHSYDEWVKLGFALASEFKEMGRERQGKFVNGKYYDAIMMDILREEFKGREYIKNKNVK